MNSDLSDVATALTGSLSRDGQGGMQDTLLLDNDGLAYVSDTNTGLKRSAADTQQIVSGGTSTVEFGVDTKILSGDLNIVVGELQFAGSPLSAANIAVSDGPVLLGRGASGAGVGEEIEVGTGLDLTSGVLTATAILPPGYLYGLTISNGVSDPTNDITFATGSARDKDDTVNMVLGSALTKQLDGAWALGNNAGGLDTGSIANDTYHCYEMMRSDTGVVDCCFSLSASAPTTGGAIPAAYDKFRRVGSIVRAGGAITPFVQNGDEFRKTTAALDITATNPGTSAVTRTLTVPTGIVVDALFNGGVRNDGTAGSSLVYFSPLDAADQAPSANGAPLGSAGPNTVASAAGAQYSYVPQRVKTNTSAQIRSRLLFSDANVVLYISVFGWVDQRGRLA